MTTIGRACRGTEWGLLAAWMALPAMSTFYPRFGWSHSPGAMLVFMGMAFVVMGFLAGPGAFLLSCVHARQMENWAPRARSVGHIRRIGILLGMPLGVANLALVFLIPALAGEGFKVTVEMAPWLIPAIAGGAGLGWGVTTGLRPGCERPKPDVRRKLPTSLRRDGPPLFDNRRAP